MTFCPLTLRPHNALTWDLELPPSDAVPPRLSRGARAKGQHSSIPSSTPALCLRPLGSAYPSAALPAAHLGSRDRVRPPGVPSVLQVFTERHSPTSQWPPCPSSWGEWGRCSAQRLPWEVLCAPPHKLSLPLKHLNLCFIFLKDIFLDDVGKKSEVPDFTSGKNSFCFSIPEFCCAL